MAVPTLRYYQSEGIENVSAEFQGGASSVLFVSATGSGKTVTFAEICRRAAALGNRVLVLAHRDQLIKQCGNKLRDIDLDHGIIMAGVTPRPDLPVQVGSVQTMVRRIKRYRYDFDLIIIDEAHLSSVRTYHEVVATFPNAYVLGVTATPARLDGKGLGRHAGGLFESMVLGPTTAELIDEGYLTSPEVYGPDAPLDLSEVGMSGSDYDKQQLAVAVDKPQLIGSAVEHYKRICDGVPAVAWCVNIKHATNVANEFNAAGIKAVALHGEHTTTERDAAMNGLADGSIKVVAFCQLLIEGVDCPAIAAVILLRPTYSLVSYRQAVGRGLRPVYAKGMPQDTREQRLAAIAASNKRCLFVIDHAGLSFRHGFVDDDIEWLLDGVKKKTKRKKDADDGPAIRIVQCEKCAHVFTLAPKCPKCGAPCVTRQRAIEHTPGELKRIERERVKIERREQRIEVGKKVSRAETLDDVIVIANERGYSEGWARIRWELKQRALDRKNQDMVSIMSHYQDRI